MSGQNERSADDGAVPADRNRSDSWPYAICHMPCAISGCILF